MKAGKIIALPSNPNQNKLSKLVPRLITHPDRMAKTATIIVFPMDQTVPKTDVHKPAG